jgi:hypothetical protein
LKQVLIRDWENWGSFLQALPWPSLISSQQQQQHHHHHHHEVNLTLAAPVELGMMLCPAALPPLQSLADGPSTVFCVAANTSIDPRRVATWCDKWINSSEQKQNLQLLLM